MIAQTPFRVPPDEMLKMREPGDPVYNSSKFAVEGFPRPLPRKLLRLAFTSSPPPPASFARISLDKRNHEQAMDPAKLASIILQLARLNTHLCRSS
jgi:hypothetical protein